MTLTDYLATLGRLHPQGSVVVLDRGEYCTWVTTSLAEPFGTELALDLFRVDPSSAWPTQLLTEVACSAAERWRKRSPPPDSLSRLSLAFATSGLPHVFSELADDASFAVADTRRDAFGGEVPTRPLTRITSLIPLVMTEQILLDGGEELAFVRDLHAALDRDILCNPFWREAWLREAGGSREQWLAQQRGVRGRMPTHALADFSPTRAAPVAPAGNLFETVRAGDFHLLGAMIEQGASLAERDRCGFTTLQAGQADIVAMLTVPDT